MIYRDDPNNRIIILFGEGTVAFGPGSTDTALHIFNLNEPYNIESRTSEHAPIVLVFKKAESVDKVISRLEMIRDRLVKGEE